MEALFVAVKMPGPVVQALQLIQPEPGAGIRLVSADRLHLTLRYIGRGAPSGVQECLSSIRPEPFELRIVTTGHFGTASRGATLWAGVQESAELRSLQLDIESALVLVGCAPEDRTFSAHVTVARCKHKTPAALLRAHAKQRIDCSFRVREFGLYSSHSAGDGPPVYGLECLYQLSGGDESKLKRLVRSSGQGNAPDRHAQVARIASASPNRGVRSAGS